MKSFTFYHYYVCPFCKPVDYLIRKYDLPHKEVHLDLAIKEHRTPEYTKINPFQKVPAIVEEDGKVVFESSTLLRYLCNKYKTIKTSLYPTSPTERARVDMFFDWFALGVQDLLKYQSVRAKYDPKLTLEEGKAKTLAALGYINLLLKKSKYIASDEKMTVADLALLYHLHGVIQKTKLDISQFEQIQPYLDRLLEDDKGLKIDLEQYDKDIFYMRQNKSIKEGILKMKMERLDELSKGIVPKL